MSLVIREEGAHPSRHTLSRFHAGELGGEEKDQVQTHLGGCEACRAYVDQLQRARDSFHADHDRAAFLQKVRERAQAGPEREPPRWQWLLRPAPLAAACAMLLAVVLAIGLWPGSEPTERIKGEGVELGYYVMEASGPVVAEPGRILHPGDRIQFRLTAPAGGYAHIVGVDEAGVVTVYFPEPGAAPEAFPGGAGRPVPASVILDATLGRERVFLLICDSPLQEADITRAVRASAGDVRRLLEKERLALECHQDSLLLTKE